MEPQFFGQFLLEKGDLTDQQLNEALEYCQKSIRRLGEIAVSEGYMTSDQVKLVLLEQRKTDTFFGELAVSMKFLTTEQLERIVTIQSRNTLLLGQALVKNGILTQSELENRLALFHKEQKPTAAFEGIVPQEFSRKNEAAILLDFTVKMFRRMMNMYLKLGTGYYQKNEVNNRFLISSICLSGSFEVHHLMNITDNLAEEMTKKLFENDDIVCDNETISDCIGELSNAICGNASARLMKLGYELQLHLPLSLFRSEVPIWNPDNNGTLIMFPALIPLPESSLEVGIMFNLDSAVGSGADSTIS